MYWNIKIFSHYVNNAITTDYKYVKLLTPGVNAALKDII